jgi:molecular chaperone Hsp33
LLVQRLPGAPEEVIKHLQNRLQSFGKVSDLLEKGQYIDEIMKKAVEPYKVRELEKQPVHFFCRCNRDRFLSALSMLSYDDLRDMEGESQEMVCHFCNRKVNVSREEIQSLVETARAKMN